MQPSSRARRRALATLRLTGAIALLATGGIHLEQGPPLGHASAVDLARRRNGPR